MTKMTKKAMFVTLLTLVKESNHVEKENLIEGLEHEIYLLNKKSENRKPSKAQQKGEEVKEHIITILTEKAPDRMTVKEIWKADEWFVNNDIATQSITAQLQKLVKNDEVVNTKDKKASYYNM